MEKPKIRLEIYEGDPFGSACCGPGPLITSLEAAEKLRKMLTGRNDVVDRLSMEFKDRVHIEREILSQKRHDYPDYVRRVMLENKPLPYIFINGEAIVTGKFPTYDEFLMLLKPHL